MTVDLAAAGFLADAARVPGRRRPDPPVGGRRPGPVRAAVDGARPSVLDRCAGPSLRTAGR
ncbi:hypothetical protein [Blastococcus mobilis]|uniref:hypothetical protein n=1 Tax=Blastococcus mobilis TaxID=1938746 RepID=UPI0011302AF4|nr:hypothetical protein [Blastococcus mobilis]